MRLALPKALMEIDGDINQAKLSLENLASAIESVRKAQKEVGSNVDASVSRQRAVENANIARKLLGVNKEEKIGEVSQADNGLNEKIEIQ